MKKLLLVVDYQNDFVNGTLGFPKAKIIEQPILDKINEYRKNGDQVAFTLDTHSEDYLSTYEGKHLPIAHCIVNTTGHQPYGKIKDCICSDDKVFNKPTFGSQELFEYLINNQYSSVELVGVVTNICIISNAVIAKTALPEADIIVDAMCTAGNDDNLHNEALDVMESLQIKIINR